MTHDHSNLTHDSRTLGRCEDPEDDDELLGGHSQHSLGAPSSARPDSPVGAVVSAVLGAPSLTLRHSSYRLDENWQVLGAI